MPIRTIFQHAFADADLPYFNPHSFRNARVRPGHEVCGTPEQFKAWRLNPGHEKVLTAFLCYGEVLLLRHGQIIRDLAKPRRAVSTDADEIAGAVLRILRS